MEWQLDNEDQQFYDDASSDVLAHMSSYRKDCNMVAHKKFDSDALMMCSYLTNYPKSWYLHDVIPYLRQRWISIRYLRYDVSVNYWYATRSISSVSQL